VLASTKKHAHQKVNVTAAFFTPSCGTIAKLLPKSSQNLNCQQNDCFAKSVLFQPNRCSCIFNKINDHIMCLQLTFFYVFDKVPCPILPPLPPTPPPPPPHPSSPSPPTLPTPPFLSPPCPSPWARNYLGIIPELKRYRSDFQN
jgi:hypothetical protein